MVDITHKTNTLRIAHARAIVKVSKQETIEAIKNNTVPKGNVFEMAKAAGFLAIKKTSDLIPDCHPLPIESARITYAIENLQININVEVKTVYKTGVEVEAMHGASLVALCIYDMLKPIDKNVEIGNICLLSKSGGKSDFQDKINFAINAALVVCSDSISQGKSVDKAGVIIADKLTEVGVQLKQKVVIPDEVEAIQAKLNECLPQNFDMIIFTGGTGLSARDITPEALKPLLQTEIPGIAEAMRQYGQNRTPYAMLSRSLAGMINKSLILALPGSSKGAAESMDAIFPALLHIFKVMRGNRHD